MTELVNNSDMEVGFISQSKKYIKMHQTEIWFDMFICMFCVYIIFSFVRCFMQQRKQCITRLL